jgi:hypothetical protein
MNYNPAKVGRDLLKIKHGFTIEVESFDKEEEIYHKSITVESRNEARFWYNLLKFFHASNSLLDKTSFCFKTRNEFSDIENEALEEFIQDNEDLCLKFISTVPVHQSLQPRAKDLSNIHDVLFTLTQPLISSHQGDPYRGICRLLVSYHPTNVFVSEVIFD